MAGHGGGCAAGCPADRNPTMLIGFVRIRRAVAATAVVALAIAACGGDDDDAAPEASSAPDGTPAVAESTAAAADESAPAADGEAVTLRLGYFPNVTHAPAIIGVETGLFEEALGDDVDARTADVQLRHRGHRGDLLRRPRRLVHRAQPGDQRLRPVGRRGAAHRRPARPRAARRSSCGRASRPRRTSPAPRWRPRRSATPRTSPCAAWLKEQGFTTDTSGGGDVSITPQENADTLAAFQAGALDGAWVPEPWATRLVERGRRPRAGRRGRPVAGRAVRDHPPHRGDRVPRRAPRRRSGPDRRARGRRSTRPTPIPPPPRRSSTTASRRSRRAVSPTRRSPVPGTNLEFTLDPIASSLQGSADDADRRRPARAGRPRRPRHLRPDAPQRGARRARRLGGEPVVTCDRLARRVARRSGPAVATP